MYNIIVYCLVPFMPSLATRGHNIQVLVKCVCSFDVMFTILVDMDYSNSVDLSHHEFSSHTNYLFTIVYMCIHFRSLSHIVSMCINFHIHITGH